jgi:hypothetical protein
MNKVVSAYRVSGKLMEKTHAHDSSDVTTDLQLVVLGTGRGGGASQHLERGLGLVKRSTPRSRNGLKVMILRPALGGFLQFMHHTRAVAADCPQADLSRGGWNAW